MDDVAAMAKFVKREELNFKLLSDPDGSVGRRYGVLPAKAKWTKRVTFVLDEKGVLRHVDDGVNVRRHGADLVALVKRLRAG